MTHKNAPLTPEGRKRLVERCRTRPVAHVAAEIGISRATASTWMSRYRRYGETGLLDRSSAPERQPGGLGRAAPPVIARRMVSTCERGVAFVPRAV